MKRDYYEVLDLERDASQQQIKSAYRKMAIRYHPDKNKGNKEAEEKFKEAAEAYSVLSDSEQRARYDRFGHAGVGQSAGGGINPDIFADFSDILGDFFGFGDIFGGSGQRRRHRAERGAHLSYDLEISFEEAAFGVTTKIKIPRQKTCATCSGSGADPDHGAVTCPTCSGRGQVSYQQGFFTISRTCSHCRGAGRIVKKRCSECSGAGRTQEIKVLELKIPAGVREGSRLRITGEGEAGANGGPPGDLYVIISVEDHPFFKRRDNDIHCTVPISFSQAALGGEIKVSTLEGDEKIQVPAATQTDTIFRLKGRGISSLNGRGRGDQLVSVKVVTPTQLNSEQKELLERLAEVGGEERGEGTFFEKVKEFFG